MTEPEVFDRLRKNMSVDLLPDGSVRVVRYASDGSEAEVTTYPAGSLEAVASWACAYPLPPDVAAMVDAVSDPGSGAGKGWTGRVSRIDHETKTVILEPVDPQESQ